MINIVLWKKKYGELGWVTTKEGDRIETFKRFMPTMRPNYFYFLTTENEELLIHAYEEFNSLEHSLKEARKGMNNGRVDSYFDNGEREVFLFPGIKYGTWPEKDEGKITPGVFTQQKNLGW